MAEQNLSLFKRLRRLFSTDVIIRNVGGKQLKVIDTDSIQSSGNIEWNKRIDRYNRLYTPVPGYSTGGQGIQLVQRIEIFRDYEAMDSDSIIASGLDIYADECLHGDTIIPLLNGEKRTIEELYSAGEQNFWIYGLDTDGTFKPTKAERVAYNGKKVVYAITLDDGTVLRSTANHLWIDSEGNEVRTDNVKIGSSILTLYTDLQDLAESSNHRVIDIRLDGLSDVYDIVNAGSNHIFAVETLDGSKLYTHNCTTKNEYGEILAITTGNEKIRSVLHNLFYDILNVDFNLWPWVRNLCKYGDFFLVMNIAEKFGIVNVEPVSAYEMMRVENSDPNNPNRVMFRRDYNGYGGVGYTSQNNETFENYEVAHFRLLGDTNFLPYGRSILEPLRKVYKQLIMMEDAMLIHRVMRAPDKRVFKIDIGNIPPNEVDAYVEQIANKMKKTPYIDPQTGDYNLKFNMMNMIEDFYLPVRGSESGTSIDTIGGLQYDAIADIDYLKNRMLAALKIPKAYLGFEEDISGKSTLASQDFRFARTIERVQRIIESELTKMAIVHLYAQGFTDEDLVDFSLSLSPASTVFEREKMELWTSKVTLAGDMMEKKLFSKKWIYENIFHMSEDSYLQEIDDIVADAKEKFRLAQIEAEGNDPSKTGLSFGTAHDIAALYKGGKDDVPKGYDEREIPEGGWPGAGRPKSNSTYGKHIHSLGWDPLGTKNNKKIPTQGSVKETNNNIAKATKASLFGVNNQEVKSGVIVELFSKSKKNGTESLLDEENLIDD